MTEDLSSIASNVADFVWDQNKSEVVVDRAAKNLGLSRAEVVWAFKELEQARHGRFVVGRRDHPSRFIRVAARPVSQDVEFSAGPTVAAAAPPFATTAADPLLGGEQSFVLMRSKPFKITVPMDLSRAEADKISRWLDVIVQD